MVVVTTVFVVCHEVRGGMIDDTPIGMGKGGTGGGKPGTNRPTPRLANVNVNQWRRGEIGTPRSNR